MNLMSPSRSTLLVTTACTLMMATACGDEYQKSENEAAAGANQGGTGTGGTRPIGIAGNSGRAGVQSGGAATGGATLMPANTGGVAPATTTAAIGGNPVAATGGSTNAPATGGVPATGGAATQGGGCGKTPSTLNQVFTFATTVPQLQVLADDNPTASLKFASAAGSPAGAPNLCNANCAALSVPFSTSASVGAVSGGGTNARIVQFFSPLQNMLGATITASIAVDNPSGVPVRIQLFTGSDSTVNWAWGNVTSVAGAALDAYSVTRFTDISVTVTDKAPFCAASTYYWALWVDLTRTVTTPGTVTVYVKQITISPAGTIQGTGGGSGTGASGGQSGSTGASGGAGRAGGAGGGTGGAGGGTGGAGVAGATLSNGGKASSGGSTSTSAAGASNGTPGESAGNAGSAGSAGLAGSTS